MACRARLPLFHLSYSLDPGDDRHRFLGYSGDGEYEWEKQVGLTNNVGQLWENAELVLMISSVPLLSVVVGLLLGETERSRLSSTIDQSSGLSS